MPRRHGRMFLRGKPGLFILAAVVGIGIFLAYYTLGGSTTKSSKYNMYRNMQRAGKLPSYQIPKSNKGFSDTVFKKNIQLNQLPKPIQPPADWSVRRNFGGMKNNEQEKVQSNDLYKTQTDRHDEDEESNFQDTDNKHAAPRPNIYTDLDENFLPLFRKMKRLVHLDLKGASPKMSYLEKVLPLMAKLGATGLLIEYEDMFPYTDELSMLAAENAYSQKDIVRLLEVCRNNKLDVIPLVQTFGHMEFVLKHPEYKHLREQEKMPQVITPLKPESYTLISKMVGQMLAAHPDAEYLHIGSDEVYGLGKGLTHELIIKGKKPEEIFLEHVAKVANLVRSVRNSVHPIIWDDEIRDVHEDVIEKSGLNKLVEPMVWNYIPDPRDRLPEDIWVKYGKLFPGIWAASSFKGATGSAQFYTNVSHHLHNHLSWVDIIKKLKDEMPIQKFQGVALTGWQRYDHFATLCELLPEALPSLAVCLETLWNGGFNEAVHRSASKLLNCTSLIELEMPQVDKDNKVQVSQDCSFPGRDFYYSTQQLWGMLHQYRMDTGLQSMIQGWLTDYHVKHRFGSPWHLKNLVDKLGDIMSNLDSLISPVSQTLNAVYDNYTVTEWIEVNLKQRINRLKEKSLKAKLLLEKTTWPKRPLHDVIPAGSVLGGQSNSGSQMGRVGQGPQMGRVDQGSQMGRLGQGPQMGRVGQGPQMGRVDQGSQMGRLGQGPQMGRVGQGPQMGRAGQGPQIGRVDQGSQMGRAGLVPPFNVQKLHDSFGKQDMATLNRKLPEFENRGQLQAGLDRLPGVGNLGRKLPVGDSQAKLLYAERKFGPNGNPGQFQGAKGRFVMGDKDGNGKYPAAGLKDVGNSLEGRKQIPLGENAKYPPVGKQGLQEGAGGRLEVNGQKGFENGPRKMDGIRNWDGLKAAGRNDGPMRGDNMAAG
ncbi:uncharacterized protein LOC121384051 isoform X2 [Gigantopelta aegis]|uniref:uncharacterized protein LOC121384051 isoform X2 n=1 Tax=Gigantopelta aegis TaxID=1735272 RepID=UPI001B88CDAE|nr:uncharacterized protein LOC121384051 isoform X2 [Gigantopelta aegis]